MWVWYKWLGWLKFQVANQINFFYLRPRVFKQYFKCLLVLQSSYDYFSSFSEAASEEKDLSEVSNFFLQISLWFLLCMNQIFLGEQRLL